MYEKILVPLDGSKTAEQVFPGVADMASAFGSEVIMLGVCEPEDTEFGQACRLYVRNEADVLQGKIGNVAKVKVVVVVGKPDREILDYAQKEAVSLLVMTSHGRSGIMPWSLGGTVSKVLREAGVPLVVVRVREEAPAAEEACLFRRILVPLDGLENGAAVLPYVAAIAQKLDSEVILLQVVEAGKHVHTIGGLGYIPYKDQDLNQKKKEALDYLSGVAVGVAGAKASVNVEVRSGDSAKEIIGCATKMNCSLIAVSGHVHSVLDAWTYGSVTAKILHAGSHSVLLVPSPRIRR